jgi:magnesium-transporting ATPase (P-type)
MPSTSRATKLNELTAAKTILAATLIAGSLDIIAAFISVYVRGVHPIKVLYYIASGVFGKETAYNSGVGMAVLGLIFHYLIAFLFTLFLFFIYPFLKSILKNKILIGVLYGIFVWAVMNKIVVPLSNTAPSTPTLKNMIIACVILILCIGIPLAWIVNKFYSSRNNSASLSSVR